MTKLRRNFSWLIVCGTGLAIAGGLVWRNRSHGQPLPVVARSDKLPDIFYQTAESMREEARRHGNDPVPVRKLAHLYQANRLYHEARACYQMIGAGPGGLTAQDHYYLADIAQNEYDLAGAQAELKAVLAMEPNYIPARLALADALFKSGSEEEAAKEYTAVLAIDANQPQAVLGLARIDLQRGNEESAVAHLEELVASHPGSTAGTALLAQILERRGETDRAIALDQLSRQKPEPPLADPWLSALLSDCYEVQRLSITFEEYFKTGKMDEALPLLDRLSALDPNAPITKIFAGFSHARALEDITAVRDYYEALAKGGDPEKICPYLVKSLLALGKVSEAADMMANSYAKMPDSIPLAKAYADVAVRLGDKKLIRALLEKVLQKEPYLQTENMSLAQILWDAGERDAAAKCLQRIATVYADDVPSRALLGEYYLGKSEPLSAIKPLEQASQYVSDKTPAKESLSAMLGTAYHQVADQESEKTHYGEAADFYEKAIRLAPADLNAYAGKANACVQLRQFRRAADVLEKMSSLQPANPTIPISLGDVYYQDGNTEQARRCWTKALQLTAVEDADLRNALNDRLAGRITAETFK